MDAFLAKTSPRHHLAAGAALLVSALIHGLLWRWAPPVRLAALPAAESGRSSYPAFEVRSTGTPPPALERPEVFRPGDPRHAAALSADGELFRQALDEALFKEPALSERPLPGEEAPLARPRPPQAADSGWNPRQDILQIKERLLKDEVLALPRRIEPDLPRAVLAPDILLPVETASLDRAPRVFAETTWDPQEVGVHPVRPPSGGAALPRGDALSGNGSQRRRGGADRLERPEEISDLQPLEQALSLDISVYQTAPEKAVYFRLTLRRREGAAALPVLPRDMVLLQDGSESMTQRLLNECGEGVVRWMEWLGPEDRFNVVEFRDVPNRCFGDMAPVTTLHKARARTFVGEMRARGKTDVFASLRELLLLSRRPEAPLIAVLVTDGLPTEGVLGSSDIIEQFTAMNAGRASVYAVGTGREANRPLLDLLTYRNRGDSIVVEERREVAAALDRFAVELRRPVLHDLSIRLLGVPEDDVFPQALPNLYLDRSLELFGRAASLEGPVVFQIVGRSGGDRYDMVFSFDRTSFTPGSQDIRRAWAKHRLTDALGQYLRTGDPSAWEAARQLAETYQLDIPYGQEEAP